MAGYLQERLKPGLSPSAIPLLARSIAKDIARNEPPAARDRKGSQARAVALGDEEQPALEADEPSEARDDEEQPDLDADEQADEQDDEGQLEFEANMYELQADLGEGWILRFSVQGDEGWLTAEKEDGSQRVEAPDAERLVTIVDVINECGGRGP